MNEYERRHAIFSRGILEHTRSGLKELAIPNYEEKLFISLPSMEGFWTGDKDPLDRFLTDVVRPTSQLKISQLKVDMIRTTSLRIFTALVLTKWHTTNAIEHFSATFDIIFRDETDFQWNDELLLGPHDLPHLEMPHLSQDEKNRLYEAMHKVSVPILQKSTERRPFSRKMILPVTKEITKLGAGGFAEVWKVQIAAGCLRMENRDSGRTDVNKVCQTIC